MTYKEAREILDGAELMLLNRDFDKFNKALIIALNLLREKEEDVQRGLRELSRMLDYIKGHKNVPDLHSCVAEFKDGNKMLIDYTGSYEVAVYDLDYDGNQAVECRYFKTKDEVLDRFKDIEIVKVYL